MSLSIADRKIGAAAVEFARDLASQAAKFAAEVERLHARHHDSDGEACASRRRRERAGGLMVTAGGAAGTGIPAAPGVSPCWRMRRGADSNAAR